MAANSDNGDMIAKRLVFMGPDKKPFYLSESISIPALQAGQVLARIRLATICGSDLHTITGKRKEPTPRYVNVCVYFALVLNPEVSVHIVCMVLRLSQP